MYIDPSDVIARLGTVPYTVNPADLTVLIDEAEIVLRRQLKLRGCDLAAMATDPDLLDLIRVTLVNAVLRPLRNPEGLKSEGEGDYSYTVDATAASANVWFPDRDLALLCPARPAGSIGTMMVSVPPWRAFPS